MNKAVVDLLEHLNANGYPFVSFEDLVNFPIKNIDMVLIKYIVDCLINLKDINFKKALVRCLTKKNLTSVTVTLINEFYKVEDYDYRWVIGNALYTINDPRFINTYLEIVSNEVYGKGREMIVLLLGKANYRNEAVKNVLLHLLSDYKIANWSYVKI